MRYFAYGSNMLTSRLQRRVGDLRMLGTAVLPGRRLAFHKRSWDGSGKCDVAAAPEAPGVHGVVYELPEAALAALDRYEGGYRRTHVQVSLDGRPAEVQAYLARKEYIDPEVRPFDWYLQLVRAGIRQHGLDAHYRELLRAISELRDPVLHRPDRLEALDLLREFYSALRPDP